MFGVRLGLDRVGRSWILRFMDENVEESSKVQMSGGSMGNAREEGEGNRSGDVVGCWI